jgi:hypothetical protein
MQTITGLFDSHSAARTAVSQLESAGISSDRISIVGRDGDDHDSNASEGAAAGAGLGAAVGGAGGLLTGLGLMAIPGVGPVVAAGWLAATAAGAAAGAIAGGATGGIIGSLTKEGVAEDDAHVYAEADTARAILNGDTTVDVASRRAAYREEGWERFDADSPEYSDEDVAKERERLRQSSQLMP